MGYDDLITLINQKVMASKGHFMSTSRIQRNSPFFSHLHDKRQVNTMARGVLLVLALCAVLAAAYGERYMGHDA